MKWLLSAMITTSTLVGGTSVVAGGSASAIEPLGSVSSITNQTELDSSLLGEEKSDLTILERQALAEEQRQERIRLASEKALAEEKRKQDNALQIQKVVKRLEKTVGRTWYVFSGATPQGWDCSGLVMWFYGELGVELEHRASKQATSGEKSSDPKIGDIVSFTYNGSKSAYHSGIVVGEDTMIHSGRKGEATSKVSISEFAGEHSKVSYTRLIDTP